MSDTIEDKIIEFRKLFVKGHGPISCGANDVQESEAWIEADIEDFEGWLRSTLLSQHQSDMEKFKEALGEMEKAMGTAIDCNGKKIKLYDAVTEARNAFRQEVLTKIGGK